MRRDPSVPLTRNHHLLRWVEKMKELTRPAGVHWVDGSQEENDELIEQMLRSGTLLRLNQETWPGCYYARSDASDVARVEQRTFVCSLSEDAAGPTNNWENPYEMRRKLKDLFNGAMRGRTMYVLPFSMGIVGSADVSGRCPADRLPVRRRQHADHGEDRAARLRGDRS